MPCIWCSDMDTIGQTIRQVRREKGISQQQLAERLGMSRNTISGIENGTIAEVGIRKVEAILNTLGYSLTVRRLNGRPTLDELLEADRG
jgi:HTH-type transcriptional regulator/antitoxin HipB